MSTILLLGHGQMGSAVASDLISKGRQLLIVDTIFKTNVGPSEKLCIDLCDTEALRRIIRERHPSLAICCLPAALSYEAVKTCVEESLNCIDMSFTQRDLSELNDLAIDRGTLVLYDMGFAPGIPNMIIGSHLDSALYGLDSARIYAGGVARNSATNKHGYVVTWSVDDLEIEFSRPARFKEDGVIKTAAPLDTPLELIQVGPYIFESFISDGIRSLLDTNIRNIVERTLRWPGHVEDIRRYLSPHATTR